MPEPEITEAQEKETLGETQPQPEPPPEQQAAPEVPPTQETPPAVPEGETKPTEPTPAKAFSQDEVEKMIQERISRVAKETYDQNQKLQEELASLRQQQQSPPAGRDPNSRDLGDWFQDPRWAGWTLSKLREEQPEYYNVALGRIGAMEQVRLTIDAQQKAQEEKARNEAYDKEITGLRTSNPEYFDPYTGRPNEKFRQLYEWGAQNGVYNLANAHLLMNKQTWEQSLKKQAVDEYLKQVSQGGGPMRAAIKDGSTVSKDIGSMNDVEIQEAYMRASNPQTMAGIEAELAKRGLL